ncbi:MAG: apolipoprotein N-acyltransferase, partial [Spirochaeta sp.]|nr:apolipoprotein N-acyltransferase [Spirochaeta sp.]
RRSYAGASGASGAPGAMTRADWVGSGAPALMLLAVALSVSSYPSFFSVAGVPALGWVSFVPLFVLIRHEVFHRRPGRAIWYGVLYGVLFTLVGNYWLGTFNLISLQAVGVIFLGFYLLYMPVPVVVLHLLETFRRRAPDSALSWTVRGALALALPLSWTAFELARSSGFLGYPWLLAAHSQYQVPAMIQTARIGGVWMVSFVVLVVNALFAEALLVAVRSGAAPRRGIAFHRHSASPRSATPWILAAALVFGANALFGTITLNRETGGSAERNTRTARIALIQQNSDPRKHDYRRTLGSLTRLTDEALEANPDLVVWSETAFVPNIRRWSQEDPDRYYLAGLVRNFLSYLETVDTWLLTGNDDYRRNLDEDGNEVSRDSYNAAVLFSADNRRQDTYHKVKLVPFTEHFPYQKQLPWVYDLLMSVDITFWTPGTEYTVFHHPKFDFATPICFEDVFPGVVRRFAREGMEVIVNITNDYWSLQEQAAQQHMAAALFRTVELGMPMVRSTASGVTSHIDAHGRLVAAVTQYSEQFLVADVTIPPETEPKTLYFRWGDWFPPVALGTLAVLLIASYISSGGARRRRHDIPETEKK